MLRPAARRGGTRVCRTPRISPQAGAGRAGEETDMTGVHDVPAAMPVAWLNGATNHVSGNGPMPTTAATATHHVRASSRAGRRGLGAVRESLSARDWQVLEGVAAHRYLTTR